MPKSSTALLLGVLFLLGASACLAQSSISGEITDPSGAVLPGATVAAASPALIEQKRTVTTDGSGRYTVFDLRPGEYTLTVTAAGFKTYVRQRINVDANTTIPVDVAMTLGATGESVTVSAELATVDVASPASAPALPIRRSSLPSV